MNKELLVDMKTKYPFGGLGETIREDAKVEVTKKVHFQGEAECQMIQQLVHFIRAARHPYLINLERVLEDEDMVELRYQYAPFKLERWLVDVNQELIPILQEQMVELAEYLCKSSLKFKFDPQSLGLSQEMEVKYFLNEFQIDVENWELNLEEKKKEIHQFFEKLTEGSSKKEVGEKPRMESISTNGSLTPTDALPVLSSSVKKEKSKEGMNLKIQDSKKRCQQIIQRFRSLKK